MAGIDVSELLLDPDFVDALTLLPRTTSVNSRGKNVIVDGTLVNTFGSVQPANQKDLLRVPDAYRSRDVRAFFIKAEIPTDGGTVYPSIITFQNKRYQIISAENWLNYGEGWNKGLCVAEELS